MLHVPRRILALIPVVLLMKLDPAAAAPNPTLEALANEYWQEFLEDNPTEATALGDHRYDARLPDPSPVGRDRMTGRLESMLDRTRDLDPARLDPDDRVTRLALIEEISGRLSRLECRLEEWNVDPLNGPQVDLVNLVDETRMTEPGDAANYVKRCRAISGYMKLFEDNLRTGLGEGKVAPRAAVVKVIGQLEDMDKEPVKDSAFLKPLLDPANALAGKDAYRKELLQVLGDDVRPAFRGYLDFLKTEVLPRSRPDSLAGMKYLPGGDDCYRKLIRVETSLDRSPAEIHETGLQEIARIRKEMSELGGRVLGTTDFDQIRERMRTDPSMYFSTAQEVEDKARTTLAKAKAALPAWFSTLPKTDCIVQVMGMHEAPTSYVGYYREPSADGSRPGCYMINTYKPETRTRYEAEALAFHESIPGHHLQVALNQEMTHLPEFRKFRGVTSFVEGWALYAERLADEMGLYSGDLDRMGMLSYDAWRASRLVVDTGMHAMGWSREQAIQYMTDNTLLAPNNITNEVDRYLTSPAQALAYKSGQMEILKLRALAKDKMGDRFDIKAFHAAVLKNGAVALSVLREQIEQMVADSGAGGSR